MSQLLPLLELDSIRYRCRYTASPDVALALVLCRLSYPTRYKQLCNQFGHSRSWLSVVFTDVVLHLARRYKEMLAWDRRRLNYYQLRRYSWAIHRAGGGDCIWGFIDGTLNATCRPTRDQVEFYSGHKRNHGYKFQSIVTPDGLVSSLMGPFIGRRGDWGMVQESGLADKLRAVSLGYCLFPDIEE